MPVDEQPHSTTSSPVRLSRRAERTRKQAISFLMRQAVENPQVISLAAGLVDHDTLPVDETRAAALALLADDQRGRHVLQYGTTQGAERLRSLLVDHLAQLEGCPRDELGIDADRLILTNGSQQLLSLVGQVLLDPGDICLVASPTYFVFLGTLAGLGARAVPVATDQHGMQMDALEQELQRLEAAGELGRVKLIYLVSYYENPSGISLSAERRAAAVKIARRWSKEQRIFVLEDAAYRELRFDGDRLPSVWSFDTDHDTVILAQTFSKSFSPGLRVGYGVVPEELLEPICDRKGNEDFGSAHFNQHLIATVFEQGRYNEHVGKVCASYRKKRDCMLAAAERNFSDIPGVRWVKPHGGLYVWMALPDAVETGFDSELFDRATKFEQVMYVPGELSYAGPAECRPCNRMRLS
ncbi:MAG: PLP-dependent aminotransferase family protein, partial [Planctomycetes bacterium]|nr:PLP-dependent aminotransferase family protein [Planctomycetota bacterium]